MASVIIIITDVCKRTPPLPTMHACTNCTNTRGSIWNSHSFYTHTLRSTHTTGRIGQINAERTCRVLHIVCMCTHAQLGFNRRRCQIGGWVPNSFRRASCSLLKFALVASHNKWYSSEFHEGPCTPLIYYLGPGTYLLPGITINIYCYNR